MRKTIVEYVSDWARQRPENVAIVADGKETTYSKLYRLVCGYGKYLNDSGVNKGDIVVIRGSQSLDYMVAHLATNFVGGVVAPVEKSTSGEGIIIIAKKLGAKAIIADLDDAVKTMDALYIPRDNIISVAEEQDISDFTFAFSQPEDTAYILFTTGTTGASKGVELSHGSLVATAENVLVGCKYREDTVMIVPGPINHASPIRKFFTSMINGSTFYILNGITNMKAFFDALDYKGSIACCLVPSAIRVIFSLTGDKLGEYKDRIDFIETTSSPLPEPDKQKLCELLPNSRLYNNFGSSESGSVCLYDFNEYPGLIGCVGKETHNSKIIFVDENRNPINATKDNMGYIACGGDINMKGYVNEPLLTKEVLIDGIVYTNDLGYKDENGFVYVAGRVSDVINVGGLKVAPTEVEEVALAYDGIEDCICIPVEDNISGKALKLLAVMRKDVPLNMKGIRDYMASKLENYKVPRYYEQVDKVERTYNGKLNRKFYQ